jgi:hypothetical protein
MPASVSRPYDKACGLVGSAKTVAADTTRPRKRRVAKAKGTVKRATGLFAKAERARRANQRKDDLSPECGRVVGDTIAHAMAVARTLVTELNACTP